MFSSNRKNKQRRKNRPGFLMVDAVFSIFIVGVILITFLAVMAGVYRTEFAKRDLIIATNLAQEGIEIVRNLRDYNWKKDRDAFECTDDMYGTNFNELELGGTNLRVQYNSNWIGANDNGLKIDSDGFYLHVSPGGVTTPTKFSRYVDIEVFGSERRVVKSRVTWDGKELEITDTLYSWGDVEHI